MDRRARGLAMIAIGIVLSLVGTLGHGWFTMSGERSSGGVGLREIEWCSSERCHQLSLRETSIDAVFSMSGNVAYFAALIGAALGVIAGALALSRQRVTGAASPARLAAAFYGAALAAGVLFVASRPEVLSQLSVGWSVPFGLCGAALAAAGAYVLAVDERGGAVVPARVAPAALPVAQARIVPAPDMTPGCPQCRAPLAWQAGRWYCAACDAYRRR